MRACLWVRVVLVAVIVLLMLISAAWADGRKQVVRRPLKPALSLLPAAGAANELGAPVLSGLDYTAVAPEGTRLRVIEDEPYVYLLGDAASRHLQDRQGVSRITLRADLLAGGSYEATMSLRQVPGIGAENELRLAFDTAAHYAYLRALTASEQRGESVYALSEVRSPLGLTDPKDKDNRHREYLAYRAAVINPLGWECDAAEAEATVVENGRLDGGVVETTETLLVEPTPYRFVQGELMVLRRDGNQHYLLTISFSAQDFPQGLTLTENLARRVLNQLLADKPKSQLEYLVYAPDYCCFLPYYEGEVPDPRVADLIEQPDDCQAEAAADGGAGDEPVCPPAGRCGRCREAAPVCPGCAHRCANCAER